MIGKLVICKTNAILSHKGNVVSLRNCIGITLSNEKLLHHETLSRSYRSIKIYWFKYGRSSLVFEDCFEVLS